MTLIRIEYRWAGYVAIVTVHGVEVFRLDPQEFYIDALLDARAAVAAMDAA